VTATTRWALFAVLPLVAAAAVSLAFVLRSSSPTVVASSSSSDLVTWQAGEQPSPPISLRAADGSRLSLASLRGRPAIVTFVDPHCTTFCPLESAVIDRALRALPVAERPAVLAVSVDPTVTSGRVLRAEAARFRWLPQWRWATGTHAELASVWRRYHVVVVPTPDDITHTELAYVLDAHGDQRALLLWPFHAADVARALAAAS
jgi:cytochrome oxidase Cu insertion factor (SCO1/SenC/PrrC family)